MGITVIIFFAQIINIGLERKTKFKLLVVQSFEKDEKNREKHYNRKHSAL
jgi:hypothetical protein